MRYSFIGAEGKGSFWIKKIDEYDMGYAQAYLDINRLLENIKTNDRHNVVDNSSDAIDISIRNGECK